MQLMVIGETELPAEHRWAIIRPRSESPVLVIKEAWAHDLATLADALAALPALTSDVVGVRRLTIDARHPGRRDLTYRRRA